MVDEMIVHADDDVNRQRERAFLDFGPRGAVFGNDLDHGRAKAVAGDLRVGARGQCRAAEAGCDERA